MKAEAAHPPILVCFLGYKCESGNVIYRILHLSSNKLFTLSPFRCSNGDTESETKRKKCTHKNTRTENIHDNNAAWAYFDGIRSVFSAKQIPPQLRSPSISSSLFIWSCAEWLANILFLVFRSCLFPHSFRFFSFFWLVRQLHGTLTVSSKMLCVCVSVRIDVLSYRNFIIFFARFYSRFE